MSYLQNGAVAPEFARWMFALAETLGAKLSESQVRMYASLLGDIPPETLRRAFRRAAEEGESSFMPTPGKLRSYVGPNADDAALLAWSAFSRAAEVSGAWAPLEVQDAAAAEALVQTFGSWPAFCEMEDGPALALKKRDFQAAYRQALRVVGDREPARRLSGLCERFGSGTLPGGACVVGVIGKGWHVSVRRDVPALPPAKGQHEAGTAAVSEGADTGLPEGAPEAGGGGDGAGGPAAGGGA